MAQTAKTDTIRIILAVMLLLYADWVYGAKKIEITVNSHNPKMAGPSRATAHWARKVKEACRGRVKMNVHYGGTLFKEGEVFNGVQEGAVDAGLYILDRDDGLLLNSFITLPFMGWPNFKITTGIYNQFLDKYPELRNEWNGVIPLVMTLMPPTQIHNTRKVIRLPSDLKGLRFYGSEHALIQILQTAGAIPVQMNIHEMHDSLRSGRINGVMNHFPVLMVFNAIKIQKYHTIIGHGGINMTPIGIIWNDKKWKQLPADVRENIKSVNHEFSNFMNQLSEKELLEAKRNIKYWGHTVTYLTIGQKLKWYNLVKKPIHDKWIAETEAKGLPGKAIYNETLKIIRKSLM